MMHPIAKSCLLLTLVLLHTATSEVLKMPLIYRQKLDVDTDALSQEDNLRGKPGQGYYIGISIGTPPQRFNALVDTGSSNFAIAAAPDPLIDHYFQTKQSSTFRDSGKTVHVPYTQGHWEGQVGQDVISIDSSPSFQITANVATILNSDQFYLNDSHWQGILGLAYSDIARPDSSLEPFFDTLVREGPVNNTFSLQLCGTLDSDNSTAYSMGGTLFIGGIDSSLYTGDILYTPIKKEWYYDVVITDVKVDGISLQMDCKEYNFDKTIVDSGTTNLRLPEKVFTKLVSLIKINTSFQTKNPPEEFWESTEDLCWKRGLTPWTEFPNIDISLMESHNTTIQLTVSPQQYLRSVPDPDGMDYNECYKFAVTPSETGTILGAVVMEGFYVVFDRENKRIGFAKTTCKSRYQRGPMSSVKGPFTVTENTMDCAYNKPDSDNSPLMIAAYVMAGICGLCALPLVFLLVNCQVRRCLSRRRNQSDVSTLLPESGS